MKREPAFFSRRERVGTVERLTLIGLLAALSLALSAFESWLPALPVPGARLGLANVAVTAAIGLFGLPAGLALALIKTVFVLLTRGAVAALMTGVGTLLAVMSMAAAGRLYVGGTLTFLGVSVCGAFAHNIGQLLCAAAMYGGGLWAYAPMLLLCGVLCGVVTGLLLNVVMPRLYTAWKRTRQTM